MRTLIAIAVTLVVVLAFQRARAQGSVRWIQMQAVSCASHDVITKGKKVGLERSCSHGPDTLINIGLRDDGVVVWKK